MGMIVCYARCWPCQFGDHPGGPHTWMDSDDIEAAKGVQMPASPEEWAALAESHPCGCGCVKQPGAYSDEPPEVA